MEEKQKIPIYQFILLIIISEIMHQYTYLPVLNTLPDNQDSWIVTILSFPYTVLICLPILFLVNKFSKIPFFDMVKIIVGKIGGKIVTVVMIFFFFFCNISCLGLAMMFVRNYIFHRTPAEVTLVFILVPVLYLTLKGFRTIAKISIPVFVSIVVSIIFFLLLGISKMDFNVLRPVLADSSLLEINIGAFITAARFTDILIIFVLAYRLEKPKKVNRVYIISLAGFVILTLLMLLPVITVLGIEFAKNAANPFYTFSKQVEVYDFIQRVEVLTMVCWLLGSILKVSIYHYLTSFYLGKIFNKSYKFFAYFSVAISFITFLIIDIDRSYIMNNLRADYVFPWITLFFTLVIPSIICLIYSVRRKKIKGQIEVQQKGI